MFFLIIFGCLHAILVNSAIIKPLNNFSWNVVGEDPRVEHKITTKIPTGIYSDLLNANILKFDFLYQCHKEEYLWISQIKWIYFVEFSVEKDILEAPYVELNFHGLDGIAEIWFNEKQIGEAKNSFVRYRINIKDKIQPENHLKIIFDPVLSNDEKNVRFLRKMQASFGTEWSPKLPSVGIWKEVELIAYQENDIIIHHIVVNTSETVDSKYWIVNVEVHCDIPLNIKNNIEGNIELKLLLENDNSITISKNVKIKVLDKDLQENVKIVMMKIFLESTEFDFIINDSRINSKGANFLPVDILPEKTSNKETINSLLLSAKMANMNMLRVPAVGLYQSDYFYELCDEYGIMVWQDMMFYEEVYPLINEDENYVTSIKTEITQQIIRLLYHPSIVLWVLSSDVLLTIDKIIDQNEHNAKVKEFINFYNLFCKLSYNINMDRKYLASTPSNNFSMYGSYGFQIADPNNFTSGDAHYSLKGNSWLIRKSEGTPKFVTQYGLRSLPFAILNTLTSTSGKDLVSGHFDQENSILDIVCSIAHHFGIPKAGDSENLIYASQINQAWSLKVQTEWFRRNKNYESIISGYNSGALLWHLNDVWIAPTSSLIEYGGKWKMVQYYARKFFNLISSYIEILESGNIDVYLLSDLNKITLKIDVKIEIFKWTSLNPIYSKIQKSKKMIIIILCTGKGSMELHRTVHIRTNQITNTYVRYVKDCKVLRFES